MGWSSAIARSERTKVTAPLVTIRPEIVRAKVDLTKLVRLDFETYYDQNYTLKKMSTSEYVRDKRFEALMMGIRVGRGKTKVVPGHKIKSELAKIDWKTHGLLCHNTAFDGFILSHHYGVVPKIYYDTLSMARGLHSNEIGAGLDEVSLFYGGRGKIQGVLEEMMGVSFAQLWKNKAAYTKSAEYCANDVDETERIFGLMLEQYPADEIKLIDTTIRMFCDPVLKLDLPRVQKEYERELKRKKDLLLSVADKDHDGAGLLKGKDEKALEGEERVLLIAKRIIGSSERFASLLRAEGVDPPVKLSPAWMKKKRDERDDSKKWAYAFAKDDLEMQELLEHSSERVRDLCECRLSVKSTTNVTKAERFLKACENGYSLPVGYSYYRAHTGRWGGNNKMNMQNLVRGGELRLSILAPKGHHIAVADSGQIEARMNAWLWGQNDLLDAFRKSDAYEALQAKLPESMRKPAAGDNRDAYCKFGDAVYGREITKADKIERFVCKTATLGLGFGMAGPKFKHTLAKGANGAPKVVFELEMCEKIVNTYRRKNYMIEQGWSICRRIIEDMAAGRQGSHKCIRWEKETIWLPNGMALKYPDLRCDKDEETGWDEWTYRVKEGRTKIYGAKLCENIVQALARIVVAAQMLWIEAKGHRIVMMTHDEVVAIAPIRSAAKCYREMHKAMTTTLWWCLDLPLSAEGGHAENYSK